MRDIVIVPSFARPEYLWLALEYMEKAKGNRPISFFVYHDRHTRDASNVAQEVVETKKVIEAFAPRLDIQFTERAPHTYQSNAYNFLEAYKSAHETDARYVYLVEDDVLVDKDFFHWHEAVQSLKDYFCTIGWIMPPTHQCRYRTAISRVVDPTAYIETPASYSSIGVCWKRETLSQIVVHATPQYYADWGGNNGYLRTKFPGNPVPVTQWTEQAGIIARVLLQAKGHLTVAWPTMPRCAHVGVNGYHRQNGYKFTGSLGNRIDALRSALESKAITGMHNRQKELGDIAAPIVVPEYDTTKLHVAQRLEFTGKV